MLLSIVLMTIFRALGGNLYHDARPIFTTWYCTEGSQGASRDVLSSAVRNVASYSPSLSLLSIMSAQMKGDAGLCSADFN